MPASSCARSLRSLEAHVLPEAIDVFPLARGIVRRTFVREGDLVRRGQDLVEVAWVRAPNTAAASRGGVAGGAVTPAPDASAVRLTHWFRLTASASGFVSRCRAEVGCLLEPERPAATIIRPDGVLVFARFEPSTAPLLRAARAARVRLSDAPEPVVRAELVSVGGVHPWDRSRPLLDPEEPVRVVVRLERAPAELLWAKGNVVVEVASDGAPVPTRVAR